MKRLLGTETGQTAVEYALMVMVAVIISLAAFRAIEGYLISNPNSFITRQMNYYRRFLGQDPNYKRFRIPGSR